MATNKIPSIDQLEFTFSNILNQRLFTISGKSIQIMDILSAMFIIAILVLVYKFIIRKVLDKILEVNSVDTGRKYAATQIVKYLFFMLSSILILDNIGIDISLLLAGSAALLVGIGIGLQSIFNDLISGLILLFEGSVQVGDMVVVNDMLGSVSRIGIRTSIIETRDHIKVIVPNSHFVSGSITNWSHSNRLARFAIHVGVAYGSDLELVKKSLLETIEGNIQILDTPAPEVQFLNFGDSSLEFVLLFWSRNFWNIESIKSDTRFAIDKIFKERNIAIPFPQRDIHIKTSVENS